MTKFLLFITLTAFSLTSFAKSQSIKCSGENQEATLILENGTAFGVLYDVSEFYIAPLELKSKSKKVVVFAEGPTGVQITVPSSWIGTHFEQVLIKKAGDKVAFKNIGQTSVITLDLSVCSSEVQE
jgi:hypothetical protein